jgi:hypothetical protein
VWLGESAYDMSLEAAQSFRTVYDAAPPVVSTLSLLSCSVVRNKTMLQRGHFHFVPKLGRFEHAAGAEDDE